MRRLCILLLLFAFTVLLSCRSVEWLPVETVRESYEVRERVDTLLVRDSVVIDRAGDTIREFRWRDRWRVSMRVDTVERRDTIREPYAVEVAAKLTAWERVKVEWGGWAMVLLVPAGLLAARRVFR